MIFTLNINGENYGVNFLKRFDKENMAILKKIQDIDSKISKLSARKKRLEEKGNTKLFTILSRCGANQISEDVLAGGILDIVKAVHNNDQRVSSWKNEGTKILKPGRGRRKAS